MDLTAHEKYVLLSLTCIVLAIVPVYCGGKRQPNGTCYICNCSEKDVVDCSKRNLTEIPKDINVTTKKLDLSSNFLQAIDDGSFENLEELLILDLHNTSLKIENVSANAFKGLTKLKFLNISQNDQFPLTNKSTPMELFEHIPSLEELRMYGTTGTYNIEYGYPDVQLSKLTSLRELWIDGLTNMTFGPAFRNMTSLKVLRLAGDNVEPSWRSKEFCMTDLVNGMFDNIASITHLYIRKCYITHIYENVFQNLTNLQYLDLSDNKKVGLGNMFKSFCSLSNTTTSLILNSVVSGSSKGCGTTISTEMIQCIKDKSIRELQLNHNKIQYIDTGVYTLLPRTLQIIRATRNEFNLGFYIFHIFYLTNLTQLDISYQFFTDEISIWRKKDYRQEPDGAMLFRSRSYNTLGNDNEGLISHNEYTYINDQSEDHSSTHGANFHDFAQYNSLDITHQNRFKNTLEKKRTVCPQLNKDRYIPPGTVLGNIPQNLRYLDLSHSKHAHPIFEYFINKTNTLEIINASYSLLYCWEGPIHGLTKLVTVDLSNNFCNTVSHRFFQTLPTLKQLNISFNFLGSTIANDVNGQIMSNLSALEVLDISFNLIETIPKLFLKSQKGLIVLLARGNILEEFNVDISHMTKLMKLDLKRNRIRTLSEKTCEDLETISQRNGNSVHSAFMKSLYVNLKNNSIDCSCNNIRFMKWLYKYFSSNSTLVVGVSYCVQDDENHSRIPLGSRNSLGDIVDKLEYQCRSYTALIIGLSIAAAFIINVILGVIVHRYRWKLRYWYYVVFGKRTVRRGDYEPIDDPRFKYDVFVASSDDQKEFVIDKLRPGLKQNGLTAFIPVYHINFNENLIHVIGKAINESRIVLFVFSDEWSSDLCMTIAVHMWQCDMIYRKGGSAVLGINLNTLRGTDAAKVREIYCQLFIDYPSGTDAEEQEAFWRDCAKTITDKIETQ